MLRSNRLTVESKNWMVISFTLLLLSLFSLESLAFDIDLSRRRKKISVEKDTQNKTPSRGLVADFFSSAEPKQELVILNTEKGFVPSRISLRKNTHYTVHVVNINQKEKNVSFILDAFSEHHSTFYGQMTSFQIKPAQEGVFSFHCPELSMEGRFIVIQGESAQRGLATQGE